MDEAEWHADSGAYSHITKNKSWFSKLKVLDPPEAVIIGDGNTVQAVGIGTVPVKVFNGTKWEDAHLGGLFVTSQTLDQPISSASVLRLVMDMRQVFAGKR